MPRFRFETPTKNLIPQPGDRRHFGHGSIVELDQEKADQAIERIKGFGGDPCLTRVADDTPISPVPPVVDHELQRERAPVEERKVVNVRGGQPAPAGAGPTAEPAGKARAAAKVAKGGPTVPPPKAED